MPRQIMLAYGVQSTKKTGILCLEYICVTLICYISKYYFSLQLRTKLMASEAALACMGLGKISEINAIYEK